jgi:membrane protease YdiL (CAAX protease family)
MKRGLLTGPTRQSEPASEIRLTCSRISEASHQPSAICHSERLAWLALVPILATTLYYALPANLQSLRTIQFIPQALGYLGLAIWTRKNDGILAKLGFSLLAQGLRWGLPTGIVLGLVNLSVILWLVPLLGGNIDFLRETPHARAPVILMLPWVILVIALGVELNFRGFLLGRLLALCASSPNTTGRGLGAALAVGSSALVFSFDPFMAATFKHLHWIAVWDGIVWGALWLRLRNLYATIVAHAVEVMIMYSVLKVALS